MNMACLRVKPPSNLRMVIRSQDSLSTGNDMETAELKRPGKDFFTKYCSFVSLYYDVTKIQIVYVTLLRAILVLPSPHVTQVTQNNTLVHLY